MATQHDHLSGSITTTGDYAGGIYTMATATRPPSLAVLRRLVILQMAFNTMGTATRPPSLAQ